MVFEDFGKELKLIMVILLKHFDVFINNVIVFLINFILYELPFIPFIIIF